MDNTRNELAVVYNIGDIEIKLTPSIVQEYIVGINNGKITLPEFKFFCEMAKSNALNPFTREIYLIKYKDSSPAQVVVGKYAILKRATTHPNFNGISNGIFVKKADGEIEKREGGMILNNESLIGSWATVYRKDWQYPMHCSCSINEIKQAFNPSWQKMPVTMAIKTATVRACRDAFPEVLGGLYEPDEMDMPIENNGFDFQDIELDNKNEENTENKETNTIDLADL